MAITHRLSHQPLGSGVAACSTPGLSRLAGGEDLEHLFLQQGLLEIPLEKAEGNAAGNCQCCPGFQPLGSFWTQAEGNVSNSVLYSVMAVLISEWKGSAAFLKH